MSLAGDVRKQIHAYVGGSLSARELEGWLDSLAPELHEVGAETVRRLVGQAYVVLAELGNGDRTVEETRDELTALLREADAAHGDEPEQSVGVATRSASETLS